MHKRVGKSTLIFDNDVTILSSASVVGMKEGEGPLAGSFDVIQKDAYFSEPTWEKAETRMQVIASDTALKKAGLKPEDLETVLAGDLLNQCIGSCYSTIEIGRPFLGLFGACSTMAESLLIGSMMVDGGYASKVMALTSSHFCTAERQYRFPLAYGSQRPMTAQWTVTGSGAVILGSQSGGVRITGGTIGTPVDMGLKDANNMGAAMAPSAADTIRSFLEDTNTKPKDYDLILTGDLGVEGASITVELLRQDGIEIADRYNDCGLMIFDIKKQDVHSGGSGCGCSAVVLAGEILSRIHSGLIKKMLFIGTGALMSPTSVQQKQPIVGIAHLVRLERV